MKMYGAVVLLVVYMLAGCAGPNPNPGERITDTAWLEGRYSQAIGFAKPAAERGAPWAELRLAMFYQAGMGVERNMPLAVQWYEKAAAQKAEGGWAEGLMIGATGPYGYFNQNSDARIAQRNLAEIYYTGNGVDKDLVKAYLYIRAVVEETNGHDIFFCCEFAGGRYFPGKDNQRLYEEIVKAMTPEQKAEAEAKFREVRLHKTK